MGQQLTATMGRLKGLLKQHAPLSANMLSVVVGIPRIRLASALRGECYLGNEREAELLTVAYRCIAVLQAIRPLEVATGDGATLKLLANNRRSVEEIQQITMLLLEPGTE